MADDLESTIESVATNPASVSVDGQTVQAHNLKDLIEADRYLTQKTAAANANQQRPGGIRFTKLLPPGAV